MATLNSLIESKKALIERNLRAFLPKSREGALAAAMEYALLTPGKRLRPLIVHLTYGAFTPGRDDVCAPFAAALEMIHAYSLVHDDLPAMDNGLLRRGAPTCHVKFGEAMAVLAGDALLNRAYEIMSAAVCENKSAGAPQALFAVASAAGAARLIGGQAQDITFFEKPRDVSYLRDMHRNKTSALFEAAFLSAGRLANCAESDARLLKKAGGLFGAAFQIKDDLADMASRKSGERPEPNIARLYGADFAEKMFTENFERAAEAIGGVGADMSPALFLMRAV